MNKHLFTFLCFAILGLTACGPDFFYEKTYPIKGANWTYADQLDFSFEIEDTLQRFNLWLEVDHNIDYDFQNLYVQIQTRFPSGEQLQEPLSLELADKIGQWHGDCNNSYCSLRIPIQENAFFKQAGTYEIIIEQFMRKNPIRGIRNVGFSMEAVH